MELKHLMSFVLTAETATLNDAVSRCYVTYSAIGQNIKVLEEELKYKVLIRTSRNITLS